MNSQVLSFADHTRVRYDLRTWGDFTLFDRNAQLECTPRGRKTCAIVAYLALHAGERISRDRLTALLWSERGEEQARASLRQSLFELKPLSTETAGLLEIDRAWVRLNPAQVTSDSARLRHSAQLGDIERLVEALGGRNGELYAGLDGLDPAFDEWLVVERGREVDQVMALGIKAAEKGLELGKARPVIDLVAGLHELDATNEHVSRIGMMADYAIGNASAVHRRYQTLREALARELDTGPSAETAALFERLTAGGKAGEAGEGSASPQAFVSGLPISSGLGNSPDRPAVSSMPFWRRKWTRRAAVGGLVAAGTGGVMGFANRDWLALQFTDMNAAQLYRQGQAIQMEAEPGSSRKALEYFKRAVTIDPDYAPAWGALALTYRHPAQDGNDFSESRTDQPQLIRAAAERALALDSGNADARFALIATDYYYRHWLDQEAKLRALLPRYPDSAIGNSFLGLLLTNVGRYEDSLPYVRRVVEIEPKLTIAWGQLAMILHQARRDQEAHAALDKAFAKHRRHPFLWNVRYFILIGAKRYREAAAYFRDPNSRPNLVHSSAAEHMAKVADALAAGKASAATAAELLCASCSSIEMAPMIAPMFAGFGLTDELFDLMEAFFFGGNFAGQQFAPPGIADERLSFTLFSPQVIAFREHPRFASILERTGLEDYWRKTGSLPDFRRT